MHGDDRRSDGQRRWQDSGSKWQDGEHDEQDYRGTKARGRQKWRVTCRPERNEGSPGEPVTQSRIVCDDPFNGGNVRLDQQRKFDSLIRVEDFFDKNGAAIGTVATSEAKKQIDEAVNELRQHVTAQGATARAVAGQTGRIQGMAKQLVRSHISPITKFARANLKGVTDYETLTNTPRSSSPKKLVSQAFAIAKSAAPYVSSMAAAGFPEDVVDQLLAATNELNNLIMLREPMRTSRVQSTKSIDKLLEQGRDGVRKIDAVLAKRLDADAPALAAWRSASRVDAKAGAVRKPVVQPPVTDAPATPPVSPK
jgi:hypothetical protein